MTERTVRYLVVDDVLADVPDAAPEVDGAVATANDVLALLSRVGINASPQAVFLHTLRPGGGKNDWRWQPLAAVSQLPPPPAPLVVKVLRSGMGGGAGAPANAATLTAAAAAGGAAAGVAATNQPPRPSGGGGGGPFGIGRLLRGVARIVTGGGGGGGGEGRPRPVGGAGSSAAAMHAGNAMWMNDRYREDEMMRERLEDDDRREAEERAQIDSMLAGPDRDGDGVPDAVEEQQQQENYGAFEDNGIVENDGNDNYGSFENDDNGGGDDDGGGGFDDDGGGGFGDDD